MQSECPLWGTADELKAVSSQTEIVRTWQRVRGESEASQETSTTGGEDTDNNRNESGDSSFVKPVVVLGREIEARAENKGILLAVLCYSRSGHSIEREIKWI